MRQLLLIFLGYFSLYGKAFYRTSQRFARSSLPAQLFRSPSSQGLTRKQTPHMHIPSRSSSRCIWFFVGWWVSVHHYIMGIPAKPQPGFKQTKMITCICQFIESLVGMFQICLNNFEYVFRCFYYCYFFNYSIL